MVPSSVLIRVTRAQRAWLEYTATANQRTQAGQVRHLIEEAMREDPLRVFVHHYKAKDGDTRYSVTIGKFGRDLLDVPSRAVAIEFATEKAIELELGRDAVAFLAEGESGVRE
jgi:hypothetical protein